MITTVQQLTPKSNAGRISHHLKKAYPKELTAADIGKALNISPSTVASHLKWIPGVSMTHRRKFAHRESGNVYQFDPGCKV